MKKNAILIVSNGKNLSQFVLFVSCQFVCKNPSNNRKKYVILIPGTILQFSENLKKILIDTF